MSKAIKQMQMDDLKATFGNVRDMVLLNVVGLGAIPENHMRLGLRKKGIRMQTVKNSLARKVFTDLGLTVAHGWQGATTVAWGAGSIADLSKELEGLIKKHDKFIKVKTALADGQEVSFDIALKMPTREQAIGQVIALALSAGSRLIGAILSPGGQLASQIKTLSEKKEEAAPEAPSPEAAAPDAAPPDAAAPA
jgi:large subunit ribosomal protein L10